MNYSKFALPPLFAAVLLLAGCAEKSTAPSPEKAKSAPEKPEAASDHGDHSGQAHGADKVDESLRESPAGAEVSFANLKEGDTVTSPVKVCIQAKKVVVEPAGEVRAGHGHHHILVDVPLADLDKPIPGDDQHIHMGDGSTCKELILAPGPHTLRLLFADGAHRPYKPPITAALKLTVAPKNTDAAAPAAAAEKPAPTPTPAKPAPAPSSEGKKP